MSLIDTEKMAKISSGAAFETVKSRSEADLDLMDVGELLRLRGEIDRRLPATALNNMNLEEELVRQYLRVQHLQDESMLDMEASPNQKAAVSHQVASTLQHLVKMQTDFHTAERFKKVEGLMVKAMKQLPIDVAKDFLDAYERLA